jgi:outer membrane protein TolC
MMRRSLLYILFLAHSFFFTRATSAQPARPVPPPASESEQRLRALLVGPRGLTSEQVARRAVSSSREVSAKRASTAAAQAKEDQATAGFWPRLQLSARYTRLSYLAPVFLPGGIQPQQEGLPPGPLPPNTPLRLTQGFPFEFFQDNYAAGASLSLPVSDYLLRTARAAKAAGHSTRAARAEEDATRRKAAADARIAYYDWIRARGQVLVGQQSLEAVRGHLGDAQKLFQAGFASKADTLRAESQVKATELFLLRAGNTAGVAEEVLRVAMHDESNAPYEIGEDLLVILPPVPGIADREALLREAIGKRPELVALAETEAGLGDLQRLARTTAWPRLDLAGNFLYANPNQRIFPPQQKWQPTWDAGVVLSWTPTDVPLALAQVREQVARASELFARRGAVLDGLRLEISQATSSVAESDAAVETSRKGLEAAEESYRVRRDLFMAGKTTLVEVSDTNAELTRARLEVVDALVMSRIARVEHALGRDVVEK